jgi:hypothetical protein
MAMVLRILKKLWRGTSPFNASSYPKITNAVITTNNFSVTIPCELGKQYQLQSVTALGSTNWIVERISSQRHDFDAHVTGQCGWQIFSLPPSDVDTDGDGVNDWEEYKLGLDSFDAYSNGQIDGLGLPLMIMRMRSENLPVKKRFSITALIR